MRLTPPVPQRAIRRPGLPARCLSAFTRTVSLLILALSFSILLEWLGMSMVWPDEGSLHSHRMLERELTFLHADLRGHILAPGKLATATLQGLARAASWLRMDRVVSWFNRTGQQSALVRAKSVGWTGRIREYVCAMINIVRLFVVRLIVLILAMPVFLVSGLVGLGEGLMRRDLRRWGGGRESSFVYHHSKHCVVPAVLSAWMLYLAMPISIHPNWILLPGAALFALGIGTATATFKKYL